MGPAPTPPGLGLSDLLDVLVEEDVWVAAQGNAIHVKRGGLFHRRQNFVLGLARQGEGGE